MFVGKDVATSLGYAKPQNALATHVDKEDKSTAPIQGTAYETRVTLINESGLYALILSSKLPQAKKCDRDLSPVMCHLSCTVESEKEMTLSKKPVEHFGLSPTNNLPSLRDKRGEVSLTKHSDYTNYSSLKSSVA